MNIIIFEIMIFTIFVVFFTYLSIIKVPIKINITLILSARLILNYITRQIYFPEGLDFSYDEGLMKRNIQFLINNFSAGKIALPIDRDGLLIHIVIASILVLSVTPTITTQLFILYVMQINSTLMVIALYKFLQNLSISESKIIFSTTTILFFDWFYFPTIDFRPEAFGLTILIFLLSLSIKNNSESSKFKILVEIILFLTHFLTFFFYSLISLFVNVLKRRNGYIEKNFAKHMILLNISTNFVYPQLFFHQSHDLISLFIIDPPFLLNFSIGIMFMFMYDIFWIFSGSNKLLNEIYEMFSKNFLPIKQFIVQQNLIYLIILVSLISIIFGLLFFLLLINFTGNDPLTSILLNTWKFGLILFILIHLIEIIKNQQMAIKRDNYANLFYSSYFLIIFGFPIMIFIRNIHLRIIPIFTVIVFPELISKLINSEFHLKKQTILGFIFVLYLNILNGAVLLG